MSAEKAEADREQLRQLTRAAHEAAADLRAATREASTTAAVLVDRTAQLVVESAEAVARELVANAVSAELVKLEDKTQEVIKDTERLIEARLCRLIGALIGLPSSVDTLEKFSRALDDRSMTRPDLVTPIVSHVFGIERRR